jgi:hypothetical protein
MTMEELLAKVPEPIRPVAAQYGPALLKMSADELWAWIGLIVQGDTDEAYKAVVAKMDNAQLLAEWGKKLDAWKEANTENAVKMQLQRDAVLAVLKALLTVAMTAFGL